MKKSILIAALGLLSVNALAQDTPKEEGFVFTTVKENPITSIKNQNRAGTCWCYSGVGKPLLIVWVSKFSKIFRAPCDYKETLISCRCTSMMEGKNHKIILLAT